MKRPSGFRLLVYLFLTFSFLYVLMTFPSDFEVRTEKKTTLADSGSGRTLVETVAGVENGTGRTEQGRANTSSSVDDVPSARKKLPNDPNPPSKDDGVRVLIQSRFRTGSTITERYFTKNIEFFGVHEPGGMIQRDLGLHIMQESRLQLETIKDQLLGFMHDIFHCNFSHHPYFFYGLNNMPYYLFRAYLNRIQRPVTDEVISPICRARPHKIIKVCRVFSILETERLIREDNVKVIFLVRDPRGMAASRMAFTNFYTPAENFDQAAAKNGTFRLNTRLEEVVLNYCEWLEENYIQPSNIPDWLQGRYLMVRYEDMEARRHEMVKLLYDFVGVSLRDDIVGELDKGNNAQRWRKSLALEEVIRVQELCGKATFDKFGYKFTDSKEELLDSDTSLVADWFENSDKLP